MSRGQEGPTAQRAKYDLDFKEIHDLIYPADVRPNDRVLARLRKRGHANPEYIPCRVWKLSPLGIELVYPQGGDFNKGEPIDVIGRVVDNVLIVHCLDIADENGDPIPNSGMRVLLETGDPLGGSPLVQSFGDASVECDVPDGPDVQPDEVRVTVCIDLSKPPMCNFLFNFGLTELTFEGKRLVISSLVKKE